MRELSSEALFSKNSLLNSLLAGNLRWRPVRSGLHPPPRIHARTDVSWSSTNSPSFSGLFAIQFYRLPVSARKKDRSEAVWGLLSLAAENRFPERGEGAARDSVRMRQRPVCRQEFREELGHDGHAIVDALARARLWRGARRCVKFTQSMDS